MTTDNISATGSKNGNGTVSAKPTFSQGGDLEGRDGVEIPDGVRAREGPPRTQVLDRDMANTVVRGKTVKQAGETDAPLGDLFFYSIPSLIEVGIDTIKAIGREVGLPEKWLPLKIRGDSAFLRATDVLKNEANKEKGRVRVERVDGVDVATVETVMIRDAPRQRRFRHIVKEVRVDKKEPVYRTLGSVEYDEGSESIISTTSIADPDDKRAFEEMADKVREYHKHYMTHYMDRDIRNILCRVQKDTKTILLRDSGGVYFMPIQYREEMQAVQALMDGIGCDMWVIPLSEMKIDPAKIGDKLVDAVDYQAGLVLKDVEKLVNSGQGVSSRRFEGIMASVNGVKELYQHYEDLLKTDISSADLKIQAVQHRLSQLLSPVEAPSVQDAAVEVAE